MGDLDNGYDKNSLSVSGGSASDDMNDSEMDDEDDGGLQCVGCGQEKEVCQCTAILDAFHSLNAKL